MTPPEVKYVNWGSISEHIEGLLDLDIYHVRHSSSYGGSRYACNLLSKLENGCKITIAWAGEHIFLVELLSGEHFFSALFYFVVVELVEAIEAIVNTRETAKWLLERSKLTKEVLITYLTNEEEEFKKTKKTKSDFIENILTHWGKTKSPKQNVCCFTYRSNQSFGPLKSLHTLPPVRLVHSGTNSASPGSILSTQQ